MAVMPPDLRRLVISREEPPAYLVCSLSKPAGRAFRPYSVSLYHAIDNPDVFAWQLYSKGVISKEVRNQVLHEKKSRLTKNGVLLEAMENKLSKEPEYIKDVLKILQESDDETLWQIGTDLKESLEYEEGKEYRKHRLLGTIRSKPRPMKGEGARSSHNFSLAKIADARGDFLMLFEVDEKENTDRLRYDLKEDIRAGEVFLGLLTFNMYGHAGNDQTIWLGLSANQMVPLARQVRNWERMYIATPRGIETNFTVKVYEMRQNV